MISGGAAIGDGAVTIIKAKEAKTIFQSGEKDRATLEKCIVIINQAVQEYQEESGNETL